MLTVHYGRRPDCCRAPNAVSTPLRLWRALVSAIALHRSRQSIADLDDALLRDIGMTREEARKEAARPIWDAPDYWWR